MRRKDRQIIEMDKIMNIIEKCDVCSLAFFDEEYPYIIPINFGASLIENKVTLYFHSANAGKKLELIQRNNKVAFEMNCSHKLLLAENACNSTMEYESVCGNGIVEVLNGQEKLDGLNYLMNQYSNSNKHEFNENEVNSVAVFKLTVSQINGKALKRN